LAAIVFLISNSFVVASVDYDDVLAQSLSAFTDDISVDDDIHTDRLSYFAMVAPKLFWVTTRQDHANTSSLTFEQQTLWNERNFAAIAKRNNFNFQLVCSMYTEHHFWSAPLRPP
jgi:hypothetical protein